VDLASVGLSDRLANELATRVAVTCLMISSRLRLGLRMVWVLVESVFSMQLLIKVGSYPETGVLGCYTTGTSLGFYFAIGEF